MKERNSNFELLRLFCMFSIVFYHLLVFRINDLSDNYWLYKALTIIFHFGVVVFILISGWFGIKLTWKRVYNIYIPCVCYTIISYLIFANSFNLKDFISIFLPFSNKNPLWFIPVYFYLCLISPLINHLLEKSSIRDYFKYLVILGIFEFYFGFIRGCGIAFEGRTIISFIFLYILGRFCQKLSNTNYNKKLIRKKCFIVLALICISILFGKLSGIKLLSMYAGSFFAYNSPGLILIAVLNLFIFSTLNIQSKTINFIVSSAFAIYLIGSNPFVQSHTCALGERIYYISPIIAIQVLLLILYALTICIGCILIDLLINNLLIKKIIIIASKASQHISPIAINIQNRIYKIID